MLETQNISKIDVILEKFKQKMQNNPDLVAREIFVCDKSLGVVYLKSMTDKKLIAQNVMAPIMKVDDPKLLTAKTIQDSVLQNMACEMMNGFDEALGAVVENNVVIFVEGEEEYLKIDAEEFSSRQPAEPPTSSVLRGPREGFTENIKVNVSMIRRRLKSDKLVFKDLFVGKYSNTQISLAYLQGVADKKIVREIEKQIKKINIDGIVSSYYVESFLEKRPYSLFKQVGSCEKPDIVCSKILEGRVAILVDNSPMVLTLPFVYAEEVQDVNDYYGRFYYATYMRWIRILGLFMAVIVPGAYLAMRLYHYKIIPLKFLITISNSNQGLPFTPFVELLFILILFEVLYEVSLRLPKYLGLATSIVGALILGDTGVKAGLISPPGVMIIAMSIISVYTIPDQNMQLSLIRLIFMILGGTLGFLGMVAGIIYFCNYMNGIDEYSAPYLAPISPHIKNDRKDMLIKSPLREMTTRPKSFKNSNRVRLKNDDKE